MRTLLITAINWFGTLCGILSIPVGFVSDPLFSVFLIYVAIVWGGVLCFARFSSSCFVGLSALSGILAATIMGHYTMNHGFVALEWRSLVESIAVTLPALAIFVLLCFLNSLLSWLNNRI